MKKLTIFIICLCITVLAFYTYKRYHTLTANSHWKNKNKKTHRILLELGEKFFEETKKHGIRSFLCAGGLLGSLRTGNIIPWDDDLDICIVHESKEHKKQIENIINNIYKDSENMYVKKTHFGFRLYYKKLKPFIDIFFISKQKEIYNFTSKKMRKNYPRYWFYPDEINKLSTCKLEDKYFPCPSNALNALKRWYGDNCMSKPKITHVHLSNPFDWVIVKIGNFLKFSSVDMERFSFKDLI